MKTTRLFSSAWFGQHWIVEHVSSPKYLPEYDRLFRTAGWLRNRNQPCIQERWIQVRLTRKHDLVIYHIWCDVGRRLHKPTRGRP